MGHFQQQGHGLACARRVLGGVQARGDLGKGGWRRKEGGVGRVRMMLGRRTGRGSREARIVTPTTTDHHLEGVWGRFGRTGEAVISADRPQEAADIVSQVTAGFLVLSACAPRFIYGSRRYPFISSACMSIVPSLLYMWSTVKLLPAWRIALQEQTLGKDVDDRKVLGGAMLVAGGTVGAGIVALPVKTSVAGLLPSTAGLIGGWGFMLLTALLILEVSKYCGPGSNFTSMAEQTLGPKWKAISAVLYIFVYSATLTAYIAESATFLSPAVLQLFGVELPKAALSLGFTLLFSSIIAMGSKTVDTTNSSCVAVALAAFAFLLGFGGTSITATSLLFSNWSAAIKMMPIMVVAFTYHNMIPSLFKYLGSAHAVRKALLIGTSIPLAMYLAWEVLILGSLPPGVAMGSVSDVLAMIGCNPTISTAINIFSLFAIITSFLGVGMGCIDFLKDLMGHAEERKTEGWLIAATMGIPTLVACFCPQLFVPALEISGILRLILFAVIPAFMMKNGPLLDSKWKGRAIAATFTMISATIIGVDIGGRLALF